MNENTLPALADATQHRHLNRKHRRQLASTRWRKMRAKEIAAAKALGLHSAMSRA